MDLLEATAPIDAFLLNRLISFTTAAAATTTTSSLWTWVAVLTTAALSLWRIRAVHSSTPRHRPNDTAIKGHKCEVVHAHHQITTVDDALEEEEEEEEAPVPRHVEVVSVSLTKGRYALYFHGEVDEAVDVPDISEGVEDEGGVMDGGDGLLLGWRGDLGWYAWQDLAALDGSVVRLWDGVNRRRHAVVEL
ncbi:hypothetical protein QJS04_geneDACA013551 [Acorus gramineus]|uniref:Uncharacterized protein n=1 Tax=Acorus gramineus TaxID=55184 RepID=A0AAV9AFZ1_ACOGR|nr:hypothetical protein QJS04_geneDACA013551 [Acorus gramineus]